MKPGASTPGIEIERKFAVRSDGWRDETRGVPMRQGYLAFGSRSVVRVRVAGEGAFLTVKGPTLGYTRREFEYAIPRSDAEAMLGLCEGSVVEKTRFTFECEGATWEVDVFDGDNRGLVTAEIELRSEDEDFSLPDWLGPEVSHLPRYANSQLSRHPYCDWSSEERDPEHD